MTELDEFLADVLPRQIAGEEAFHNGDPEPRIAMWTKRDPVTLLGAWGMSKRGWEDVSRTFRWVASRFSNCTAYDFELLAADVQGDLAYSIGFERGTVSTDGGPPTTPTARVTHVYRREDGEWKIVHRHGDRVPVDESAATDR
jgi:ketosteroid isomerase-like protein